MKRFAIGDGNLFIDCPDRFCADLDGNGGWVVWDPDHEEIVILLQVGKVRRSDGKADPNDGSLGLARVKEIAHEKGEKTIMRGNVVLVVREKERYVDEGHCLYFRDAGIGNYFAAFSFTLPESQDGSDIAKQTDADIVEMMASLVERKPNESVFSELLEGDHYRIEDALESLFSDIEPDKRWDALQTAFLASIATEDEDLACSVGLAMTELLREEVPTLNWTIQSSNDGRTLAVHLGESGICMHPETLVVHEMERKNRVNLRQLADDTLGAMEELMRKQ